MTSDTDGRFELAVPGAEHDVHVEVKAGERVTWYDSFDPAERRDLGTIRMVRGYPFRGRCLDGHGAPLPNVVLELRTRTAAHDGHEYVVVTRSDASGRIAVSRVAAGVYGIDDDLGWQGLRRLEPDSVTIRPDAAGTDVVFRLERVPSITGVVFGRDGRPVPRVPIAARAPGRGHPGWLCSTASRDDGSFVLHRGAGDAPDEVELVTGDDGPFEPTRAPGTYRWDVHGVRLDAVPARSLGLIVLEQATRRAVESFALQVRWIHGDSSVARTLGERAWHANGTFVFDRVLRSEHRLTVVPKDPLLAPAVRIVAGDAPLPQSLTIELDRLHPRAIHVDDARGGPGSGMVVDLFDPCGATDFRTYDDPRTGRSAFGPANIALRLSTATTDEHGNATLVAPPSRADLVLVARRPGDPAGDHVEPLRPARDGEQALRITLPAR